MIPHPNVFWLGLALSLLGYGAAAYGVTRARRAFTGRRGVVRSLRAMAGWLLGWVTAKIRRQRTVTGLSADIGSSADLSGTLTMKRGAPTTGDVEEILAWMFRKFEDHDREIEELREGARTTARQLSHVAAEERTQRTSAVEALNERIQRLAGDGLRVTALGVFFLMAGTVLLAVGAV
jgi:hypothetical protein